MARLVTSFDGDDGRLPVHPVKVLRLKPGEDAVVQTLSPTMGGMLTHFIKGQSEYCMGSDCPAGLHATKTFWKGYFACDVNIPNTSVWRAHVCELSEAAELDIRGFYCRGLILKLSRRMPVKKNEKPPLKVEIIDLLEENALRDEFDILPVLRIMYHVNAIKLDKRNPLPDRVVMEDRESVRPGSDKTGYVNNERPITPQELHEKVSAFLGRAGKSKPAPKKEVG